MREFILRVLKGRTSPDFSIDKLVEEGRLDLVCRCIMNALCVANAMRRDTIMHVCMDGPSNPPKTLSFDGATMEGLRGDERSTAIMIKKALTVGSNLKTNEEVQVSPGLRIAKRGFEKLVQEKSKMVPIYYLHAKGEHIHDAKIKGDCVIVLGDYIGMPRKSEKLLENVGVKKISLGKTMLLASQCITVVHYELDQVQ